MPGEDEEQMAIYSYYSSTGPDGTLHQNVQSAELKTAGVIPEMNKLAGLRALMPAGQTGEMMSYLLERNGYSILGLSYTEKQNVSGNFRNMRCSLQFAAPPEELADAAPELGKIVNFISFQKPPASGPAPLSSWPLLDGGYYYHNSASVLPPLVDGLVRVAMSPADTVMLIGLPKEKKNGYAFARYTMAELFGYLPVPVRVNIRFFTGLPVESGAADPGAGFDNAIRYGANVIFCPHEFFAQLSQYRQCISVDMDQPGAVYGAFADYITRVPDVGLSLAVVDSRLSGQVTYESLNKAAQTVRDEGTFSIGELRRQLEKSHRDGKNLEEEINRADDEYNQLVDDFQELQQENERLRQENEELSHGETAMEELRKDMQQRQEKIQALGRKLKEKEEAYQKLQREYNSLVAQQLDAEDGTGSGGGEYVKQLTEKLREAEQKQQAAERKLKETERRLTDTEWKLKELKRAYLSSL